MIPLKLEVVLPHILEVLEDWGVAGGVHDFACRPS
jgi:hypothetical protein